MTLTVDLEPDEEARLREQAAAAQTDVLAFVRQAILEKIGQPSLTDALKPIREAIRDTDLTPDEIDTLVDRGVDELRRERRPRATPP